MDSKGFQEKSGFPKFILIILVFQSIVTTLILLKDKESPWVVLYVTVPLILLFAFSFLRLRINQNYFEYSFFPFTFKTTKIPWNEIQEIQFVNTDPISDFGGWGVRFSKKYGKAFITGNNEIIFLQLKNGKKRSFTIINKEKILYFFNENEISFINNR